MRMVHKVVTVRLVKSLINPIRKLTNQINHYKVLIINSVASASVTATRVA